VSKGKRAEGARGEREPLRSCSSDFSFRPFFLLPLLPHSVLTCGRQARGVLEVFAHSGAVVVAHGCWWEGGKAEGRKAEGGELRFFFSRASEGGRRMGKDETNVSLKKRLERVSLLLFHNNRVQEQAGNGRRRQEGESSAPRKHSASLKKNAACGLFFSSSFFLFHSP